MQLFSMSVDQWPRVVLATCVVLGLTSSARAEEEPDDEGNGQCTESECTLAGQSFVLASCTSSLCGRTGCAELESLTVQRQGEKESLLSIHNVQNNYDKEVDQENRALALECRDGALHVWDNLGGGKLTLEYDAKTSKLRLSKADQSDMTALYADRPGQETTAVHARHFASVLAGLYGLDESTLWQQRMELSLARIELAQRERYKAYQRLNGHAFGGGPNAALKRPYEQLKGEWRKQEDLTRPLSLTLDKEIELPSHDSDGWQPEDRHPFWKADSVCLKWHSNRDMAGETRCWSRETGLWTVQKEEPATEELVHWPDWVNLRLCQKRIGFSIQGFLLVAPGEDVDEVRERDENCGTFPTEQLVAELARSRVLLWRDQKFMLAQEGKLRPLISPETASELLKSSPGSAYVGDVKYRVVRRDQHVVLESRSAPANPWLLPIEVSDERSFLASPDQQWLAVVTHSSQGPLVLRLYRVAAAR